MPPARRRPPVAGTRRPKVAGRAAVPPKDADPDTTASDTTASDAPATDAPATDGPAVDLSKPDRAATEAPATEPAVTEPAVTEPDATEPAATEPDTTERPAGESAARAASVSTATVVLGALAVVFAVIALVAVIQPGTNEVSNEAWVDTEATAEVTSATRDALQTVFSYQFDTIDEDQAAARAVLTDDRLEEYDSTAEQTKQGVLQTSTVTTATVTDIGASVLDGDRAELVASMDISATQDSIDQGTVQTPVAVVMQRVDGVWKVSEIDNR